jgi:hypothetical protein
VNKDKYQGSFQEGKKEGRGVYYFSEGTVFSGIWSNDEKLEGELVLFNGDIFVGTFRNNMRFQGTYKYKNGDVYYGEWR